MNRKDRNTVLEAIKMAIITELRGFEIYNAAVERTDDPTAKLMFKQLADDELHHKKFLEKNFRSVLETGEWAVPATPETLTPFDQSEIVSQKVIDRVKAGSFEMAVVAAGVELERSAIEFYNKAAKDCPDEESAAVFSFLANWEADHLRSLILLEGHMREQYFAKQGFARF